MRSRLLMTPIVVTVLVAGCTAGIDGQGSAASTRVLGTPGATTPGVSSTGVSSTAPTSTTTTTVTTTATATSTAPGDVLSGPIDIGPGAAGYLVFRSPSGNIHCGMSGSGGEAGVRCDLVEADYPDVTPLECGDVGDFHAGTASLDGDGPAVIGGCLSDTVIDPNAVLLPYGSNAGVGDLVCHSAEDGVTCGNIVSGRGFQVARASYRVF